MLARLAVSAAALIALTACAGMESAGRNARASASTRPAPVASTAPLPRPAPPAAAPTVAAPPPAIVPPPPARVAAASPPPSTPTPAPRAAPVEAPPPAAAPVARTSTPLRVTPNPDDDEVVVPGQVERQVRPPAGDPRSVAERMQDINSWDRCVTHVQSAFERDPMRPQLESPEEYCAQSLGMTNRNAVPESRRQQR